MKRWDKSLAGKTCPICNGTGSSYEHGDLHRSPGTIPCPRGLFQGHGYPTCHDGTLQFSEYDLKNWSRLKRQHPEPKTTKRKLPPKLKLRLRHAS